MGLNAKRFNFKWSRIELVWDQFSTAKPYAAPLLFAFATRRSAIEVTGSLNFLSSTNPASGRIVAADSLPPQVWELQRTLLLADGWQIDQSNCCIKHRKCLRCRTDLTSDAIGA
jgi:hypothetical protein